MLSLYQYCHKAQPLRILVEIIVTICIKFLWEMLISWFILFFYLLESSQAWWRIQTSTTFEDTSEKGTYRPAWGHVEQLHAYSLRGSVQRPFMCEICFHFNVFLCVKITWENREKFREMHLSPTSMLCSFVVSLLMRIYSYVLKGANAPNTITNTQQKKTAQ